jgi:hypothetical protein
VAQVKLMGSFSDYVGAHGHAFAAATTRPLFRGVQQKSARSTAAFFVGHYQAIHFGAQWHLEKRRNADVQPANNIAVMRFGDEHGAVRWRLDLAQSLGNLCGSRGIPQLAGKLRDTRRVAAFCAADFDRCLLSGGICLLLFYRHGGHNRMCFQSVDSNPSKGLVGIEQDGDWTFVDQFY